MSDAPEAATGFDVWSLDESSWAEPPDPTSASVYRWDEQLVPRHGGDVVGRAVFRAESNSNGGLDCTGWIQVDGGQPWAGTVLVRGSLTFVDGKVGAGTLDVLASSTAGGPRHVRVSRENPKRYVAQG